MAGGHRRGHRHVVAADRARPSAGTSGSPASGSSPVTRSTCRTCWPESGLCRPAGRWSPCSPTASSGRCGHPGAPGLDRSYGITRQLLRRRPRRRGPAGRAGHASRRGRAGPGEELGLLCGPDLAWRLTTSLPTTRARCPAGRECDPAPPTRSPRPTSPRLPRPGWTGVTRRPGRDRRPPAPAGRDRRPAAPVRGAARRASRAPVSRVTEWRAASTAATPRRTTRGWAGAARRWRRHRVSVPPSAFAAGIIAARESVRAGLGTGERDRAGAVVARGRSPTPSRPAAPAGRERLPRRARRLPAVGGADPGERPGLPSAQRAAAHDHAGADARPSSASGWCSSPTPPSCGSAPSSLSCCCATCTGAVAFAGRSEAESFFVRCDDSNNPLQSQALGRLVAEVGVAPAAPLEYLVLGSPRTSRAASLSRRPVAEHVELLQTFRFTVHLTRNDPGATGAPWARRVLRVHRARTGGRRQGVPRRRSQRRRRPPGRPGQARRRWCSSAGCSGR